MPKKRKGRQQLLKAIIFTEKDPEQLPGEQPEKLPEQEQVNEADALTHQVKNLIHPVRKQKATKNDKTAKVAVLKKRGIINTSSSSSSSSSPEDNSSACVSVPRRSSLRLSKQS